MDRSRSLHTHNLTESTTANSSSTHPERVTLYSTAPDAYIVLCVYATILITGVVGNTLLILSFVRHKSLSTPHNALVVNLASGDFIFLIISLPFNMIWYTFSTWPFGLVICKLSHFAESLAMAVVICTLSILSIERCLIVTGKKLWRRQKRGPIWLTIGIWTFSLLVSLPNLISSNLTTENSVRDNSIFCFQHDKKWGNVYPKVYVASMFILLFCLPLIVIGTAYILIAVHLLLRAFPFSPRKAKTQKIKGKIYLRCLGSKRTSNTSLERNNTTDTDKSATNVDGKLTGNTSYETDRDHIVPLQHPRKSDPPSGANNAKSYSPDSCTEMTELQQTPILPYCFVYTGPIPAEALPKLEDHCTKLVCTSDSAQKQENSDSWAPTTPSAVTWKETSALNQPSSCDLKPGYKQRQNTIVTKRRRLAVTVLALIIAFAFCWTPRHVYLLWFHFDAEDFNTFWYVFKILGFCLSSSNSAVNPIVFYILDSTYRSFVHKALCLVCLKICRQKTAGEGDAAVTLGDRDYNATIALSDMKSKGFVTEL